MAERDELLGRIAQALERLAPATPKAVDWKRHPAYVWDGEGARAVSAIEAPALEQLRAVDRQKSLICENIARLAGGHSAHDMLLWGSRGMGKSALIRAAIVHVQADKPDHLALVQIAPDALVRLPRLFECLRSIDRQFVIFIDDLGFDEGDASGPRRLRSWLEGGVEARAANCRLAITANRRAIVSRRSKEQDPNAEDREINIRDAVDDTLALADRFGLSLGFHPCSKDEFLEIVHAYADPAGLAFAESEALSWAVARGHRSGRSAWQFVCELAGRAGKAL